MRKGGPGLLDKTHATAAEPNWEKSNRKKTAARSKERASELEQMNRPDAFVPRNLRGAVKGADGSFSVKTGWTRDSWKP